MTPAVLAARRAGLRFALHAYRHDDAAPSRGVETAARLGLDPAVVFKTLVARLDDGRLAVAIVPVARQLDLKALAAAAGAKRATMAEVADAERATGYVAGGISPLGQRRRLPTVLDVSARDLGWVYVSAGRRGLQIELDPADLARACGAVLAPITMPDAAPPF